MKVIKVASLSDTELRETVHSWLSDGNSKLGAVISAGEFRRQPFVFKEVTDIPNLLPTHTTPSGRFARALLLECFDVLVGIPVREIAAPSTPSIMGSAFYWFEYNVKDMENDNVTKGFRESRFRGFDPAVPGLVVCYEGVKLDEFPIFREMKDVKFLFVSKKDAEKYHGGLSLIHFDLGD